MNFYQMRIILLTICHLTRSIGLAVRVFTNGLGDRGSVFKPRIQNRLLSTGLKVHCIPYKVVRPPPQKKNWCPSYNTKLYLMTRLQFWLSEGCEVIPSDVHSSVVVPVRILLMGQIDLFRNYLYLIELCTKNQTLLKKQPHK